MENRIPLGAATTQSNMQGDYEKINKLGKLTKNDISNTAKNYNESSSIDELNNTIDKLGNILDIIEEAVKILNADAVHLNQQILNTTDDSVKMSMTRSSTLVLNNIIHCYELKIEIKTQQDRLTNLLLPKIQLLNKKMGIRMASTSTQDKATSCDDLSPIESSSTSSNAALSENDNLLESIIGKINLLHDSGDIDRSALQKIINDFMSEMDNINKPKTNLLDDEFSKKLLNDYNYDSDDYLPIGGEIYPDLGDRQTSASIPSNKASTDANSFSGPKLSPRNNLSHADKYQNSTQIINKPNTSVATNNLTPFESSTDITRTIPTQSLQSGQNIVSSFTATRLTTSGDAFTSPDMTDTDTAPSSNLPDHYLLTDFLSTHTLNAPFWTSNLTTLSSERLSKTSAPDEKTLARKIQNVEPLTSSYTILMSRTKKSPSQSQYVDNNKCNDSQSDSDSESERKGEKRKKPFEANPTHSQKHRKDKDSDKDLDCNRYESQGR